MKIDQKEPFKSVYFWGTQSVFDWYTIINDNSMIVNLKKWKMICFATKALEYWEMAAELIVQREQFIYDLESFERFASDPNRYFLKGHRGSSAARLEEALLREKLYKVLSKPLKRA